MTQTLSVSLARVGLQTDGLDPLEELNDLLAESPDLALGLRAALKHCLRVLGREGGLILLQPAPGAEAAEPVAHQLPTEWTAQLADPDSSLVRLAQRIAEAGQAEPFYAAPCLAGTAPLSTRGHHWGALLIAGQPCHRAESEFLLAAGRAIGRTIQLHQLLPADSGYQPAQSALNKIATTLTSTLQLDEILTSTVEGIRQLLKVEAASLVLRDDERGELIFKKTLGGEPDWIFQYSLKVDRGLIGECITTGQPLMVHDAATDPRFDSGLDGVVGFETRGVLCAPLNARGHTLGAIELINKQEGRFTRYDQDVLVSMGASVANALYNARLFHQITVANAALEASRFELLRSRSTLQALFDGITAPIYIVDRDYRLVAANLASAQQAGAAPAALVGQTCYQALYGSTAVCSGCPLVETWSSGKGAQTAQRRWARDDLDRNGTPVEWETNSYPIRNDNGQVTQAIVFSQDVTEKRRLEASLAQSEKLAAVGQLAAGVAHEINNPLAAIIANSQLLQRELPVGDDRRESVDLIALAGDRASRVVRDLLDFARQEPYQTAPTDVNASIASALTLVDHEFRTHSLNLILDLEQNLPLIEGGHDRLQGVWLNLLMNARDAVNSTQGEIRLTSRRTDGHIVVTVADNGVGIPAERLSRVFEPFYTTKAPGHGTGLGLSVCHQIIKQHGGDIQVSSLPGQGTTFTVSLPLRPQPAL